MGCSIGKLTIEKLTRSLLPFYFVMVIVLLLITFVPAITLTLPNLVFH